MLTLLFLQKAAAVSHEFGTKSDPKLITVEMVNRAAEFLMGPQLQLASRILVFHRPSLLLIAHYLKVIYHFLLKKLVALPSVRKSHQP